MKKYLFKKIDAFATGKSSGNPAACVYLEKPSDISEIEMQQIAFELKGFVNEVGFLSNKDGLYHLCYYSSECEVDFCGHATIAIMYDLIKKNPALQNQAKINIYVKNSPLFVLNKIKESNAVYIAGPRPEYLQREIRLQDICLSLNILPEIIEDKYALEVINAGLRTLIIPIKGLKECTDIFPDEITLKEFCFRNDIDIVLVFCKETYDKDSDYRTRVFAPKFGYLEDPATGSGNAAFGYYLLKHHLWDKDVINIEQNGILRYPNFVKLVSLLDDGVQRVLFGGAAITRISGEYFLNS